MQVSDERFSFSVVSLWGCDVIVFVGEWGSCVVLDSVKWCGFIIIEWWLQSADILGVVTVGERRHFFSHNFFSNLETKGGVVWDRKL